MENLINDVDFNVLESIYNVSSKIENSKIDFSKFNDVKDDINKLSKYLGNLTEQQTIIFVCYFKRDYNSSKKTDFYVYFDKQNMGDIFFLKDFDILIEKNLLVSNFYYPLKMRYFTVNYLLGVPFHVSEAICNNQPISFDFKHDQYSFIQNIDKLIINTRYDVMLYTKCSNDNISPACLLKTVELLEEENLDIEFISNLRTIINTIEDRLFFYIACLSIIEEPNGYYDLNPENIIHRIFDNYSKIISKTKSLIEKTNPLITNNLIEFIDNNEIKITQKGLKIFAGDDFDYFETLIEDRCKSKDAL